MVTRIFLTVLVFISSATLVDAQQLRVGQSDSIEFDRVWSAIMLEAGLDVLVVSAPHARKRQMFVDGEIVLDCCAIPAWRQQPAERAVQLFSDPFFPSAEHYIFRQRQQVDPVENAAALRFVQVAGFHYDLQAPFGDVIEVRNIEEVLDHVASGAADVAIVNRQDFERRVRLKPRPLQLGPVYMVADLAVRVHKERADLLPRINAAIAALKQRGEIASILAETDEEKAGRGAYVGVVMVGRSDTSGTQRMWREILAEAGIRAVFMEAPQERKRRMFTRGRILLDCCAAPIWRTRGEEVAIQAWSDTFFVSKEIWVFRKGEPFRVKALEDLRALRVAAVRGFDFLDQDYFGVRVPGRDVDDTLRLLAARRADATILGELDYDIRIGPASSYFMKGPVRVEAGQKIRAHARAQHFLPQINAAISRLKAAGRISAIVQEVAAESTSPFKE